MSGSKRWRVSESPSASTKIPRTASRTRQAPTISPLSLDLLSNITPQIINEDPLRHLNHRSLEQFVRALPVESEVGQLAVDAELAYMKIKKAFLEIAYHVKRLEQPDEDQRGNYPLAWRLTTRW